MDLVVIAAMAKNGVISNAGTVPWHYPEDLERFKSLTMHHPVIMGRKTWESLPAQYQPLPGRENIVLTHRPHYIARGAALFHSFYSALECLAEKEEVRKNTAIDYSTVYVIGGQSVYEQALPEATKLELTIIHQAVPGDAFFPTIDKAQWKEVVRATREAYSFVTYIKK